MKLFHTSKGASLGEYGLLVGLIAVGAITSVLLVGEEVKTTFCTTSNTLGEEISAAQGNSFSASPICADEAGQNSVSEADEATEPELGLGESDGLFTSPGFSSDINLQPSDPHGTVRVLAALSDTASPDVHRIVGSSGLDACVTFNEAAQISLGISEVICRNSIDFYPQDVVALGYQVNAHTDYHLAINSSHTLTIMNTQSSEQEVSNINLTRPALADNTFLDTVTFTAETTGHQIILFPTSPTFDTDEGFSLSAGDSFYEHFFDGVGTSGAVIKWDPAEQPFGTTVTGPGGDVDTGPPGHDAIGGRFTLSGTGAINETVTLRYEGNNSTDLKFSHNFNVVRPAQN